MRRRWRVARRPKETGLASLRLHDWWRDGSTLPLPFDVDVHRIPARGAEPEHLHLDLRYLLLADPAEPPRASEESEQAQWVARELLPTLNDEPSLLRMAEKAIVLLRPADAAGSLTLASVSPAEDPALSREPAGRSASVVRDVVPPRWRSTAQRVCREQTFATPRRSTMTDQAQAAALGSFASQVAHFLAARADELSRRFLDSMRSATRSREIEGPTPVALALPDLVRAFAATLDDAPPPEAAARLERELTRLVRLRRAQGRSSSAVLLELGTLEDMIFDTVLDQASARGDRVGAGAVLGVVKRFHRTTRELAATTRRLYQRDLIARRRSRAALLGAFSRVITHELRNRANAARLSFAVLRASPEDERAEPLAALGASLELLEAAIADVDSVASVQARQLPTESRLESIGELLDQLRGDFEQFALTNRIDVRWAGPFPDLAVDADKLQFVVFHLIANALKHADRRKEACWVEIRATPGTARGECRFDIEDNGLGLPGVAPLSPSRPAERGAAAGGPELREAQPESQPAPPRGEIGIELALEAVRQLGGRLWIDANTPAGGTTVSFTVRALASGEFL